MVMEHLHKIRHRTQNMALVARHVSAGSENERTGPEGPKAGVQEVLIVHIINPNFKISDVQGAVCEVSDLLRIEMKG